MPPPPPSPDHSSHVAHAAFSHRALFGSVNINTARDPKRGNTRRYTDRSGISHVSAQWPSHISKKRSVSLNALWSGSKKRKVRPIRFLENKIGGKPCQCRSWCGHKALLYVVSFPRQSGPFHRQGPQRSQAKETRHKTAFLPGCCMLTDVTVKPRQWCHRLNRVNVVKK